MRIACISDIHGNIYALKKVLENIDDNNIDQIICLGDLTGYGPHPNEVVALIRRRKILCLKGNYDASVADNEFTYIRDTSINSFSLPWTSEELRISHKYYLHSLPENLSLTFEDKKILFVHGSPRSINEYLKEDSLEAMENMSELPYDILVCAHTHIPYVKEYGNKILINDGSVGKPKNGKPHSTYAIIDIKKNSDVKVEIKEVEYDVSKIIKDMEIKDFPYALINSIKSGVE
ncbi:metallophosphoesterase family protein [Clostridium polynesiense]|uniref:metallophosphoesterase family protein n=1 Tax=Clostridium polynesiense TaxID=1325933 RepID=UPI00058BFD68|nr:metallophosphoesterase family protein [Clostridium polynesiense]